MRLRLPLVCTASILEMIAHPSGAVAQEVSNIFEGAPADPADHGEIVVTAIRRSIETSQSIKWESDQIVDLIVAEDIRRLPDVTATESLARISGVQVDCANGTAAGTRLCGPSDITTPGKHVFWRQSIALASAFASE